LIFDKKHKGKGKYMKQKLLFKGRQLGGIKIVDRI